MEGNWQKYLLNEDFERNVFTYIQGLQELVNNLKPKTMAEQRRITLAKQHISEIKKYSRRMQNRVDLLEEKLNILEEALNENEEK
jgi:hypothetical protein|tara:strand:+ start:2026 stop:2280 length:255 start_codon:yes stop_codon:yes gene_type:complete